MCLFWEGARNRYGGGKSVERLILADAGPLGEPRTDGVDGAAHAAQWWRIGGRGNPREGLQQQGDASRSDGGRSHGLPPGNVFGTSISKRAGERWADICGGCDEDGTLQQERRASWSTGEGLERVGSMSPEGSLGQLGGEREAL